MTESHPAALRSHPVVIKLPVQWGDQDAIGHVNNVVVFRWFESVRIAYLERLNIVPTRDGQGDGFILASNHCDYRRQINYPDVVLVGARVGRIGTKSFTYEMAVYSEQQHAIVADGQAVVVAFDYTRNETAPLNAAFRDAVAALQADA